MYPNQTGAVVNYQVQPYPLFAVALVEKRWEAERVLGWCANGMYVVLAHHGPIDFTKRVHFFGTQAEADSFASSQTRPVLAAA